MASLFTARRKPKRVASAEPRDDGAEPDHDTGPVVRRPTASAKPKSKLRISFDPSEATTDNDGTLLPTTATRPSRLGESAAAIQSSRLAAAGRQDQDGPIYNKSYLEELKGSTPTTPKDLSLYNSSAEDDNTTTIANIPTNRSLDLAAKFGTTITTSTTSTIPSAAEIQEKKDRRARLAKEQQAASLLTSTSSKNGGGSIGQNDDYISLDAYNSDGEFKPSRMQVTGFNKADHIQAAQEHTRLVPEDEDIAEGFDSFVDDDHVPSGFGSNRILMSRAAATANDRDRKTLRALIDEAEGKDDGDSDGDGDGSESDSDSDASLQHAYNAAQTSRGTAAFGGRDETAAKARRRAERDAIRPRQPEKTTAIPTLTAALGRLRELQGQAEVEAQRAEKRKAEIQRRLVEVESEKGRIQQGLEELGRQLEETRLHGADGEGQQQQASGFGIERNVNGNGKERIERGLDNIGDG